MRDERRLELSKGRLAKLKKTDPAPQQSETDKRLDMIVSHSVAPSFSALSPSPRKLTSDMNAEVAPEGELASRAPPSAPVPKCLGCEAPEKRSNKKRSRSSLEPRQHRARARQKFRKSNEPRPTVSKRRNDDRWTSTGNP